MEVAEVRESKFLIGICLICAIIGGLIFCFCLSAYAKGENNADIGTLLTFGLFFLFTSLFVFCLARRKLALYAGYAFYIPYLGRKRMFSYHDVRKIKFSPFSHQYQFIGQDGKKLAVFEFNMTGSIDALYYLEKRGIPFETARPLALDGFPWRRDKGR